MINCCQFSWNTSVEMACNKENWSDNAEIKIFQEYLKIRTDHPDVDYAPCVEFLLQQADSLGLVSKVYYPDSPSRPIPVLTWPGTSPELPSIMLNSHMDVVAVTEKYWSHPPFAAEIDGEGRIFARGSQDMKSVGMQYLGAIRALKHDGIRLKRTIHVVFTPDEEIGGFNGIAKFVPTSDFAALNIGFCIDEGMASPTDEFPIFYGERFVWSILFRCRGSTGHASLFHKNTAIEKIQFLMNKFLNFRKSEEQRLENNPNLTVGDVTSVNITTINGGIQQNVVPPEIMMSVDVRMSVNIDYEQFDRDINDWCKQAGDGIEIQFIQKLQRIEPTKLDDNNKYWLAFKKVLVNDLQLKIKPQILPAATDSRHLREINVPVIGFSPMNNTPVLLHEHDEFIKASTYLEGITIYKKLLLELANL
ncbi:aminoacylase-1-like [Sitodiplosis mosellana]|uniref:aminoacylase-1-like n=1 Tax=Sitodiplosis mosellana TaxID=263140 RepID=UPI002444A4B9|nr:aminoacylase-1-like [Sitodiplosis mosellana]